ncbi:hypothetical protein LCGC14_2333420, partial [marine sediment metagenome]
MVLSELSTHGPMRVKDIVAQLVGVSPSTLTRILDRLEQEGMVKRTLNPMDRRSFRVTFQYSETVSQYRDRAIR